MDLISRLACLAGQMLGMRCGPSNNQSTYDAASRPAALINDLHWALYYVFGAVEAALIAVLIWALWRGTRRRRQGDAPMQPSLPTDRRLVRTVALGMAATVVILFGSLLASLAVTTTIDDHAPGERQIEVVSRQWWWEIRYLDKDGRPAFASANEIHIPVGQPVLLRLRSPDVIHSLWVPSLHGKRDLIPGHHTSLLLQADRPGVYRGQCAEFCGLQHAQMALLVVAHPANAYAEWFERESRPATLAAGDGQGAFAAAGCDRCHMVRGTTAAGAAGPDLTHIGSRRTIAAGTLPNTREAMMTWLREPQAIKPGTQMPPADAAVDLARLADYLEGLR